MNALRHLVLVLVLAPWGIAFAADPVSEMAEFSVFGKVDLAELAKGDIKTATGAPMSTARYLSAGFYQYDNAPESVIGKTLGTTNPVAHFQASGLFWMICCAAAGIVSLLLRETGHGPRRPVNPAA